MFNGFMIHQNTLQLKMASVLNKWRSIKTEFIYFDNL